MYVNQPICIAPKERGGDEKTDYHCHESSSGLKIHTDYEGGGRSHRSDVDFEIMVPERFDISIDSK